MAALLAKFNDLRHLKTFLDIGNENLILKCLQIFQGTTGTQIINQSWVSIDDQAVCVSSRSSRSWQSEVHESWKQLDFFKVFEDI